MWLPFAFFATYIAAAQIEPNPVDAHFILLAKHPEHTGSDFILLERREHLWELPHVKAHDDNPMSDAGLLKSVARASFKTVPIDPQRVFKFEVIFDGENKSDSQANGMVFVAMSGREANPLLLDHELNRLNALNPDVRELRWVEFKQAAFVKKNNIAQTKCLGSDGKIRPSMLALNNISIDFLSSKSVGIYINHLLSDQQVIDDTVQSFNLVRRAEPSVIPRHFMIATKLVKYEHFLYFVEQNGSYTFPLIPKVTSSKDYAAKVQQKYGLEYETSGNMYKEISHLHKDGSTGTYYSDIYHLHSAKLKTTFTSKSSLWCNTITVALACRNPYSNSLSSVSVRYLDENEDIQNKIVAFDKYRLCPLFVNAFSDHDLYVPNSSRHVGVVLFRTVNNKRYSLFMAHNNTEGGWAVPEGFSRFPEDYGTIYDPLLVGTLRNLEEKTYRAFKLDIDQVEKECTTISKNDEYGAIYRYSLCSIDNNSAYTSEMIRKKQLTVIDEKCYEWAGNIRWICLDDILVAAKTWKAPVPFMVNAETLSDDDSYTYRSNYRITSQDIDILTHSDFPKSLASAIAKDNSFNSAFMITPFKINTTAYAGALMLDSAARKIGFAKDVRTASLFIPILPCGRLTYFTTVGKAIGSSVFFASLVLTNHTHPILNYDTLKNNFCVSKNILLYERTMTNIDFKNCVWVKLDEIATHPLLSDEEKAIFTDASCQETLKFWIGFYSGTIFL